MDDVDREAETKELKDITGPTVDREGTTVKCEIFQDVNRDADTKEMHDVDRDAETKELKDITGPTVDQEGTTVECEIFQDVNRDADTKEGDNGPIVPKIQFHIKNVPANIGLLKGLPISCPIQMGIEKQFLFGRGHSAGAVYFNDDTVSRQHMKLFVQFNPGNGQVCFVVQNVSPKQPVFLNGHPFYQNDGIKVLQVNDQLRIGQLDFSVKILPGDSCGFYQVEFTKSEGNPQHLPSRVNDMSTSCGQNPGPVIMANQVGAVFMPNSYITPRNPPANISFSSMGAPRFFQQQPLPGLMPHPHLGVSPFTSAAAPQQQYSAGHGLLIHQPSVHGPVGFPNQPHPSNHGMTSPFFQQPSSAHHGMGNDFGAQQTVNPGMPVPVSQQCTDYPHGSLSPKEKRDIFQHKQPSENSEEKGREVVLLHVSVEETQPPKS